MINSAQMGPRRGAAPLRLAVLAAAVFAIGAGVLALANRGGAPSRPGLSALTFSVTTPGLNTDQRIARLQTHQT